MYRLIARVWHYTAALLTSAFNAHADPRIQIEQAMEESRQQHLRLVDQAAAVIGNEIEVRLKIERARTEMQKLDSSAAQALHLAQGARERGDATASSGYERSAQLFATQLAAGESSLAELSELHQRAALAAAAARRAIEQNRFELQRQIAERARLLSDLEAARMQERMADALRAIDRLAPADTVPTLPQLRERIDQKIAVSAGRIDVAVNGVEARMVEVERAMVTERGTELLAGIRRREGVSAPEEV